MHFNRHAFLTKLPKCLNLNFSIFAISLIYALLLIDLSGYTEVFSKLVKLTIFDIFNELLLPQNVNVARFARCCKMRLFL